MRRRERGISKPGEPKRMPAKGRTCNIEGCGRSAWCRGMCRRHYRRAAMGLPVLDPDDGRIVGATPSGRSLWGVVEQDGERLVCHECGRSYLNLSVHVAMAHHMPVRDYRLRHGLTMRQRMVSERLQRRKREIGRGVAHNLIDARTPDTLKLADQRLITRGRRLSNSQSLASDGASAVAIIDPSEHPRNGCRRMPVTQYDLGGRPLRVFGTRTEAATWLREHGHPMAQRSMLYMTGRHRSAYGFQWREGEPHGRIPPLIRDRSRSGRPGRPVVCFADGKPYRSFGSLSQAAQFLAGQGHPNARAGSLRKALSIPGRTAYGFTWRYADDQERENAPISRRR